MMPYPPACHNVRMLPVTLIPLEPSLLPAFEDLLGGSDFGGCFCAVWTSMGPDWGARCGAPARPNLARTKADLRAGREVGFLVMRGGVHVGWTGAGPRDQFPLLGSKRGSRLSDRDDAWGIGCLAIPAAHRGQGLADAIVEAVAQRARSRGAGCVEAFPVRPFHEPRAYRGSERLFARHGFTVVGLEEDGEHAVLLMRRELSPLTA